MKIWKGIILLLLLVCSCRQEEEYVADLPTQEYPEGATVEVSFSLRGEELATKTLGEGGTLDNLYLAVFGKNGYLKEYVKATLVGPEHFTYQTQKIDASGKPVEDEEGNPVLVDHTVNRYAFKARLSLTESKRIIHLIGNGPSTLSFGWDTDVMANLCCKPGEMGYWQILELDNGIRAKRYLEGPDYIDEHEQKVQKLFGDLSLENILQDLLLLLRGYGRVVYEGTQIRLLLQYCKNLVRISGDLLCLPKLSGCFVQSCPVGHIYC